MVEILTKTTKGQKEVFEEKKVLDFYIDFSFALVSLMLTFMSRHYLGCELNNFAIANISAVKHCNGSSEEQFTHLCCIEICSLIHQKHFEQYFLKSYLKSVAYNYLGYCVCLFIKLC